MFKKSSDPKQGMEPQQPQAGALEQYVLSQPSNGHRWEYVMVAFEQEDLTNRASVGAWYLHPSSRPRHLVLRPSAAGGGIHTLNGVIGLLGAAGWEICGIRSAEHYTQTSAAFNSTRAGGLVVKTHVYLKRVLGSAAPTE